MLVSLLTISGVHGYFSDNVATFLELWEQYVIPFLPMLCSSLLPTRILIKVELHILYQ